MSRRGGCGCYLAVRQAIAGRLPGRASRIAYGLYPCHTGVTLAGDHERMSDDCDIDTYGVWDPIGNPHSDDCLCSNCGPTEYALNVQAERERRDDERARIAESQAMSRMVLEHREKYDYIALAEERRWSGISYRLAFGLEVSPKDKRWHDEVLAKRRARYARTKSES